MRLYKLDQGQVSGLKELTGLDNVFARVKKGDPSYFTNIAQLTHMGRGDIYLQPGERLTSIGTHLNTIMGTQESRVSAQTSEDGRLRYTLEPKQHDWVKWKEGVRTNKCDGLAPTKNNGATVHKVVTGCGHDPSQPWAVGTLYTNKSYAEDYNHHMNRGGAENKSGYTDHADSLDVVTTEWKKFDSRRRTPNTAKVISDFLILQTSGGDQSIFYFDKDSEPRESQAHFPKVIATPEEMFDTNSKSIWKKDEPCATDKSGLKVTDYFINLGGYNGFFARKTGLGKYQPYDVENEAFLSVNGKKVSTFLDHDPAKTVTRPSRQGQLIIAQEGIKIKPTAINKIYTPKEANVFYKQMLGYFTLSMDRKTVFGGTANVLSQLDLREASQGQSSANLVAWGDALGLEYQTRYSRETLDKVNSVIVDTPVSTEFARVLPQEDIEVKGQKISRDQRVAGFVSVDLSSQLDDLNVCPLDPGLCEYRYLDCQYYKDIKVADYDFNAYYDKPNDAGTGHTRVANTYIKSGKWVTLNKVSGLASQLPQGYEVQGGKLRAKGLRWELPLSDLGLNDNANTRIKFEMDLTLPSTVAQGEVKQPMLIGFENYGFMLNLDDPALLGTVTSGDGNAGKKSGMEVYGNEKTMHLSILLGLNNVMDTEVEINGKKAAVQIRKLARKWDAEEGVGFEVERVERVPEGDWLKAGQDLLRADIGDTITIGSWLADDDHGANYTLDNLTIWKKGGTHNHNSACYKTVIHHSKGKYHEHTEACYKDVAGGVETFKYTGGVQKFIVPHDGRYEFKVWGAQGGHVTDTPEKNTWNQEGGSGGYARCKMDLYKGTELLIYVGGQGEDGTTTTQGEGGWNGGGKGGPEKYNKPRKGAGGGGASDIRTSASLEDRLIVAGGGGGAGYDAFGFPGGLFNDESLSKTKGQAADQDHLGGGGGGGHYGGGVNPVTEAMLLANPKLENWCGGYGGSSYVSKKCILPQFEGMVREGNGKVTIKDYGASRQLVCGGLPLNRDGRLNVHKHDASCLDKDVLNELAEKLKTHNLPEEPGNTGEELESGRPNLVIGEKIGLYQGIRQELTNLAINPTWSNQATNKYAISDVLVGANSIYVKHMNMNYVSEYTKNADGTVGSLKSTRSWYGDDSTIQYIDRNSSSVPTAYAVYVENGQDKLVGWSYNSAVLYEWTIVNNRLQNRQQYNTGQGTMPNYSRGGWDGGQYVYFVKKGGQMYRWDIHNKGAGCQPIRTFANWSTKVTPSWTGSGMLVDVPNDVVYAGSGANNSAGLVSAWQYSTGQYLGTITGSNLGSQGITGAINSNAGNISLTALHRGTAYYFANYVNDLKVLKVGYKKTNNKWYTSNGTTGGTTGGGVLGYPSTILGGKLGIYPGNKYSSDVLGNAISDVMIGQNTLYKITQSTHNVQIWNKNSVGVPTSRRATQNWNSQDSNINQICRNNSSVPYAYAVYVKNGQDHLVGWGANGVIYDWQIDGNGAISNRRSWNSGAGTMSAYSRGGWDGGKYVYFLNRTGDKLYKWDITTGGAVQFIRTLTNFTTYSTSSYTGSGMLVDVPRDRVYSSAGSNQSNGLLSAWVYSTGQYLGTWTSGNVQGQAISGNTGNISLSALHPGNGYHFSYSNATLRVLNLGYQLTDGSWANSTLNGNVQPIPNPPVTPETNTGGPLDLSGMLGVNWEQYVTIEHTNASTHPGGTRTFNYTGNVQSFTAPSTGTYTFEVWGAQGGGDGVGNEGRGGNGGYAKGVYQIQKGTQIQLVVGGQGKVGTSTVQGGYNGGGNGYGTSTGEPGCGGGGATDIRIGSTALGSRVIVAGGGGGGGEDPGDYGGAGGGLQGTTGNGGHAVGTQTSGYQLGQGRSITGDGGGGGGGYYGGNAGTGSGGTDNQGGSGGSGYIGGVTQGTMRVGVNTGHGRAVITYPAQVIKEQDVKILDIAEIIAHQEDLPDLLPDGKPNPLFKCKREPNAHMCTDRCVVTRELNCSEPHHMGSHYDASNRICWKACGNDDNHKANAPDHVEPGVSPVSAKFLQLDHEFTVYFPNRGNFSGNGRKGIGALQSVTGAGYTSNMDTTEWTREKRVKFEFDVINKADGKMYLAGEWVELNVPQTHYDFYIVMSNKEAQNSKVSFEVEAINCGVLSHPSLWFDCIRETTSYDPLKASVDSFKAQTESNWLTAIRRGYDCTPTPSSNQGYSSYMSKKLSIFKSTIEAGVKRLKTSIAAEFGGPQGINERAKPLTANDNYDNMSNRKRSSSYEHKHGGFKEYYLDVIGRIGNFAIMDTEDYRFSNFFKVPKTDPAEWFVDGVVYEVEPGIQNYYLGDAYTLKGDPVDKYTRWLNTYARQSWSQGTFAETRDPQYPNIVTKALTADINNISELKEEQLRYGYDIYTTITTIGDYQKGNVLVAPYYYALNLKTSEVEPIDVYIAKDGEYTPVNLFGNLVDGVMSDTIYPYIMNLDWQEESRRRNYTVQEKRATDEVAEYLKEYDYDYTPYSENGEQPPDDFEPKVMRVKHLKLPEGTLNTLGDSQSEILTGEHRTFVGNTVSFGTKEENEKWGSKAGAEDDVSTTNTEAGDRNPGDRIPADKFHAAGQRWHFKIGIPSASVFVKKGKEATRKNIKEVMNKDYAILSTTAVIAQGEKWAIEYDSPWLDTISVNGKEYKITQDTEGKDVLPLVAVYSAEYSSELDVDIIKTH